VWNAFFDIVAGEPYEALSPVQQLPHLVFWYWLNVDKWGHVLYFEQMGDTLLEETIDALTQMGLACHAQVLRGAAERWRNGIAGLDADDAYASCSPTPLEALRSYLARHEASFIEYEPAVEQADGADEPQR
jgi:hypothetical protein